MIKIEKREDNCFLVCGIGNKNLVYTREQLQNIRDVIDKILKEFE